MGLLWPFVKISTRLGLAGGAVYGTLYYGCWDTQTDRGYQLFQEVKKKVIPGTIVYPEKLPAPAEVVQQSANCWNEGVKTVFGAATTLPTSMTRSLATLVNDSGSS